MHAHIFHNYKKSEATTSLQINGQNIAFFVDPIKNTSEFLSSENGQEWRLRFFIGSEFEKELTVCFDGDGSPNKFRVGRACWLNNNGKADSNSGLVARASLFLRQSESLTLSRSVELTSDRNLLADRDGIAYFSSSSDQFKRIVLCQSLAIAYTKVLSDCMARMTEFVRRDLTDKAIELYEHILRFNAAHYFSLPILLERHEVFAAWQVMREHYHLNVLNQELTQQLSDVAALLKEHREKQRTAEETAVKIALDSQRTSAEAATRVQKEREDQKDRRRNFLLSLAGVLLTATSLLSLLQLTPKQFSENAVAWKGWLLLPVSEQTVNFEPNHPVDKTVIQE
jgi:hypothetical protein